MNALQHTPLERKSPCAPTLLNAFCRSACNSLKPDSLRRVPQGCPAHGTGGRRPRFTGSSARKRKVLQACKRLRLDSPRAHVLDCTVFRAILVPPGGGGPYLKRRGSVHKARYDVVVLVAVATVQLVEQLAASEAYRALDRCVRDAARE